MSFGSPGLHPRPAPAINSLSCFAWRQSGLFARCPTSAPSRSQPEFRQQESLQALGARAGRVSDPPQTFHDQISAPLTRGEERKNARLPRAEAALGRGGRGRREAPGSASVCRRCSAAGPSGKPPVPSHPAGTGGSAQTVLSRTPKGALVAFGTSETVFKATDVPLQAHRLRNTGSLFNY